MKPRCKIKQHDITDCGAACLASVAAFYHLQLPLARIRQYAATDKKGTNVLGLITAAEKLGFQAKGVKGNLNNIREAPLPFIAHVVINKVLSHYIVVYKINRQTVTVMDPVDGRYHRLTIKEFGNIWTGVLMLLLPAETFIAGNEKTSNLSRFWALLQPHRTVGLQALFGAVVYTILGLAISFYVQNIIDHVLIEGNKNLLNLLSVIMLGILLLQLFIGNVKSIFALKTGQQIDIRLILGYYQHLLLLPQQFFDTMRVGEITSRISDAVKIRLFINEVAMNLIVNFLIVVFSFVIMFAYYWKLALIIACIIPLYFLIYAVSNQVNKKYQRRLMENSADLGGQLVESLNAAATIKRFGLETYANLKTENRFVVLLKTIFHSTRMNIYLSGISGFTTSTFTVILLWCGATFVIDRQMTPGELLSFYAVTGYFTGPMLSLIGANKSIQDALIAADRLFEIMDLEQESTANKTALLKDITSDIIFSGVTFRYGSRNIVFSNFNMKITGGAITAIVGESGSGKTTLMALLQNLYPLQEGHIFIGPTDIRYIGLQNLRERISIVPQQVDLFAVSILENIAIGEFEPDMTKILRIADLLGFADFIDKMPNGYLTMLGEHGANLSGGQRQRIAIARALYREPDVLILDEATSSLDPVAEQYVLQTVKHLRRMGKTVIVIAHRLSTVIHADSIIVLKNGYVAGEGKHQYLMDHNEVYSALWNRHLGLMAE
ncbi:MAG TPA: peptidase domain-containing ABC transporter [Chitinophaga sp.]|uniref:peptidase domain-containing ABC transporter n=1 Tax=Chitinophaga sp. TaxID=1869181 RepID=UPI002BB211C6|nr:peptidase domain-containing ABC transporter [Chitinophaga sp.]HVI48033.1 peptidase domain-containing ABC transporter [Chitinophaga sp.]